MKCYVTGRSSNYKDVEQTFVTLKELGHEITFEWTALPMVKPYNEHPTEAAGFAEQGITGVVKADVYIMFAYEDGNGVFTEFGAALASNTSVGTPRIYVIGKEKQYSAMFYYHPAIEWFDSIEDVLEVLQ